MKVITAKQLFLLCLLRRKDEILVAKNTESYKNCPSEERKFYVRNFDFVTLASKQPDISWYHHGEEAFTYKGTFEIDFELNEFETEAMKLIS